MKLNYLTDTPCLLKVLGRMNTSPVLFLFLILVVLGPLRAQKEEVYFTNAKLLEDDRYEGIKGFPYLLQDWVKADITRVDDVVIQDMLTRYNGFTGGMEVRMDNKYIVLDESQYKRVEIQAGNNKDVIDVKLHPNAIVFEVGFHADYKTKFAMIPFKGKELILVSDFKKKIETKTFESPGKTVDLERFTTRREYYLIHKGKRSRVNLKVKSFMEVLGKQKEIEQFMKKEKIKKIKKETDAIRILEYYDILLSM